MIIDTNRRTTAKLDCLHSEGVRGIIRYYARTTQQPEKRITRGEAEAIIASGKSIAIVHQAGGASPNSFSAAMGRADAEYAFRYAISEIGQPAGSTIYFAVDFDCGQSVFEDRVVPHFEAIHAVNTSGAFAKQFDISAYGNGLVLDGLLKRDLIRQAWLSQSVGHYGSKEFKKSDRWTLFQRLPSTLCGIGVDEDILNGSAAGYGQFNQLDEVTAAGAGGQSRYQVIASGGLRLRAGPGVGFEIIDVLAAGSIVEVLSRNGNWAVVDVGGDGLADGAVHSAFLKSVS